MMDVQGVNQCEPEGCEAGATDPHRERPSRIAVEAEVTLSGESGSVQATACDVSENGLKIAVDGPFGAGPITVKLPGFPLFTGEIRWRGARHIGVQFLRPVPWDFLTTWVKAHGFRRRD